jgi:signal transduction histidine kinase
MLHPSNISALFTREHLVSHFGNIFVSAVIVDSTFRIVTASRHAAKLLEVVAPDGLIGKCFKALFEEGFSARMSSLLDRGYFYDQCFRLNNTSAKVNLAGFHLGMISDINDLIVISVDDCAGEHELSRQLKSYEERLEHLIYRASHDLRGPIATIQGLVNIGMLRSDDKEVDMLLNYIGEHANKLDASLRDFVKKMNNILLLG